MKKRPRLRISLPHPTELHTSIEMWWDEAARAGLVAPPTEEDYARHEKLLSFRREKRINRTARRKMVVVVPPALVLRVDRLIEAGLEVGKSLSMRFERAVARLEEERSAKLTRKEKAEAERAKKRALGKPTKEDRIRKALATKRKL